MGFCGNGVPYVHGVGMMPGMMFLWIAIIAAIIYFLTRNRSSISSSIQNITTSSPKKEALDILVKRYASGEISDEEFETKRKRIHQEF